MSLENYLILDLFLFYFNILRNYMNVNSRIRDWLATETPRHGLRGGRRGEKLACKPGSVEHLSAFGQSFIWAGSYLPARATYPGTARAALLPPYLVLLRMGFAVPLLLPETRWALTLRSYDRPRPLRDAHRFTIA
jgi:hypothetical protein